VEERWEEQADAWAQWRRADAYVHYAPTFFELVPPPGSATLEVGCGEGRVARDYLVGHASELPSDDAAFDLVVAYNVLMDVDDLGGAVAEAGRVLAPGGRLCACVTHPLNNARAFEGREHSYLESRPFEMTEERDGVCVTFRGWTHSFEDYSRALESAGLVIEAVREPAAPAELDARWRRVPMFLMLRAAKPA
jgi:SAM-dependent methyltransferase